ncbi:MAG TPA: response regulator transcription factor [Ktedonobacteraceae bacterium]|jgi:NarL family two-component system response regulator YdfI|nr:response regulator transcription factor [Ktedonobacteraceae bacterium]
MSETIRVVIADDHPVVRTGLRLILGTEADMELVGEAADGAAAVRLVNELQPDVVLVDVRMPEMDGLQAIEHIRRAWPQVAVLILTTYNEDELMLRGLQAGARGYLLKESSQETLLHAIRAAARGEMVMQPEVMARILTYTNHTPVLSSSRRERSAMNLTERERAVLEGLVRGERNKEIAARMGITMRTVEAHLTSIYTKLQVDSRSAAIVAAIERGLLPPIQAE